MALSEWQRRLHQHFAGLRERSPARPIFALEHALSTEEVIALQRAVRHDIASGPPATRHSLPWIVYAAEVGYQYSGDEYWQTFETDTPGWTLYGERGWVRERFEWFGETFGGAKPTGAWADHFSIVSWPLVHAIVPRDHQQRLVRILYDLRDSLTRDCFESPVALGELISAHSWSAPSRFRNLADQTALIGQIAAALLLGEAPNSESLIHPAALRRIGSDLDRERSSREWLRGARHSAQERVLVRGLHIGRARGPSSQRPDEARAEVAELGIAPRLKLRPTSDGRWQPVLEIPDLTQLTLKFPQAREILTQSRCTVAGAIGTPLARARLLHGPQSVPLGRWPRPDETLLKFERTDPWFEYLLRTECLLRPGPSWLFKLGSDGVAYELRQRRVRAGSRYLLASTTPLQHASQLATKAPIACAGIWAVSMTIPDPVSAEWEEWLADIDIARAKTIEVWPVGLAPAVWDGEGYGEWLASERPCLAVRADHEIGTLAISLSSGLEETLEVADPEPGKPVFLELPPLPIGQHKLRIATRRADGAKIELVGEVDVHMRIREPRPWSPGFGAHGPLSAELYPTAPTLEDMWEGQMTVAIEGPADRLLNVRVAMFESGSESREVLARQLPPLKLPLRPREWSEHFRTHFREAKEAQQAYDDSKACSIEFSAEELGSLTVRCERAFTPVRWTLRRSAKGYTARLHEDVGAASAPLVKRFSFEFPTAEEVLATLPEYASPSDGGLYVAEVGSHSAAMIVPPVVRGFDDLRCTPRFGSPGRSIPAILRTIGLACTWKAARLPGDPFSATRQRLVLQAMTSETFRVLGGEAWGEAEANARDGSDADFRELKRCVSRRVEEAAIGAALALQCEELAVAPLHDRVARLAHLIGRFVNVQPSAQARRTDLDAASGTPESASNDSPGPGLPTWDAELALRLASAPYSASRWAVDLLPAGVAQLMNTPTLARAARFLVLSIDRHLGTPTRPGELYAGWSWQ